MSHRSNNPRSAKSTRSITLTEEEALALLEICFHSEVDDDGLKMHVMGKVSDLCREFIQAGVAAGRAPVMADMPNTRETLESFVQFATARETIRA